MTNCIIIDDEPDAITILSDYINDVPELVLVGYSTQATEMLTYLRESEVHLVFLDINMPQISGIAFIKLAKQIKPDIHIILTTAHSEYAIDGFDHQVMDYLLKPIAFDRFLQAVQRIPIVPAKFNFFFVKGDTKNSSVKINIDEILYIEAMQKYVGIHMTNGQRIITLQNMKDLEYSLPIGHFKRIHRSYILPITHIKSIDGNRIYLHGSERVFDIGKTYREGMAKFLKDNGIG
jgi:DNA-binding LytR/AlgR family response regulator